MRANATALNATLSRVVFTADDGVPVTAYLAAPPHPKAAVVYVPGANEPVSGHAARFASYPDAGIAFLYLDVRGNGFETPGEPGRPRRRLRSGSGRTGGRSRTGSWPTPCGRGRTSRRRTASPSGPSAPRTAGGTAAIAAGIDPAFAGYAGVSTSGFGTRPGSGSVAQRFEASVDPSTYIGAISPRPVLVYHAEADPVIPFAAGRALFEAAKEPKTFVEFNGSHGINPAVDADLVGRLTQIYGP